MRLDIGFAPTSMNVTQPGFSSDYGFFDGVLNPSKGKTVAGGMGSGMSPLGLYGASLSMLSTGLNISAMTEGSLAQIDNIMRNIGRTERNIDQIQLEMMDTLDIQVRKVSRRHGTQMARIGASGVGFSGSPLMVMAETHRRGMEDYEAIEQRGRFAIDSAYLSIYDNIDMAKDIADSIASNATAQFVSGLGSAAGMML